MNLIQKHFHNKKILIFRLLKNSIDLKKNSKIHIVIINLLNLIFQIYFYIEFGPSIIKQFYEILLIKNFYSQVKLIF